MGIGDAEREWLKTRFAGQEGRFLEIGSFDGVTDSISLPLIEMGWEGVLVEPHPKNFNKLWQQYKNNPRIEAINAAVSPSSGLMPFHDDGGGEESTLDKRHMNNTKYGKGFFYEIRPFWINTVTMAEIFRIFGFSWRFILIDIEGMDVRVLRTMPMPVLLQSGLEALCIEYSYGTPEERNEIETLSGMKIEFHSVPNYFLTRRT